MDRASLAVLRQREFALLWWGGLISMSGTWMLSIAVPIAVYQLTGSAAAMALVVAAVVVPRIVIGPLAGVFVDRWDRKPVLVVSNLAQAVALLPMLLVDSAGEVWIVAVAAGIGSALATFTSSAENALLPTLVTEDRLPAANSLNAANNNFARLVGPLLGGVIAVSVGLFGVVIIDASTYLVAAALIAFIPGRHAAKTDADHGEAGTTADHGAVKAVVVELADGLRVVRDSKVLWVLLGFLAINQVGEGIFSTLYVVFVSQELNGGSVVFGWLNSAQAVGGILGGLAGGWVIAKFAPRTVIGVGGIAFGVIDLVIFNYPQFFPQVPPAVVLMVAVGIPGAMTMAAVLTMMQTSVADAYRGRVFAFMGTVTSGSMLIGTGIAALTAGRLDVVTVLNLDCATIIVSGILVLVLLRAAMAKAEPPTEVTQPATAAG